MRTNSIGLLLAGAFVALAQPVHAQTHPVIAEGHIGYASFVDDAPIEHSVFGAGARVFVTPRVAIEQASTFGWERYVGRSGRTIGMKTFGASAPLKELQRKFGFETEGVVAAAKAQLGKE